jgi:hypothetical protein
LRKERLKKLLNLGSVIDALQEPPAEPADTPHYHPVAAQNGTDVRRNGSNGNSGFTTKLTQDYQHMAQHVVITVQDAGEKAADVGGDLLRSMKRVAGRKRASRKKTRLWLEESV